MSFRWPTPGGDPLPGGLAPGSTSSVPASGPTSEPEPFDPARHEVRDVVTLPYGYKQIQYADADGNIGVALLPPQGAGGGGGGGAGDVVGLGNLAQRQQEFAFEQEMARRNFGLDEQSLAERQRQYNESFGMDKARGDQQIRLQEGGLTGYFGGAPTLAREQFGEDRRQFDTGSAIDFYKHISNVASNPRSFMENFFTTRGQPAPPGSEQFANSPGISAAQPFSQFFPNFLQTAGAFGQNAGPYGRAGPSGPLGAAPFAGRAPAGPAQAPAAPSAPQDDIMSRIAPGGSNITMTDPRSSPISQGPTRPELLPTLGAQDALNAGGRKPLFYSDGAAIYDRGGIIPEPVTGRGDFSGRPYRFGESGPEGVIPADILPAFLKRRGGTGSYQTGGVIGYDQLDPYSGGGGAYGPGPTQYDPYAVPSGQRAPNTGPVSATGPGPTYYDPYAAPSQQSPTLTASTTPPPGGGVDPYAPSPDPGFVLSPEQQAYINAENARINEENRLRNQAPTPIGAPAPPSGPALVVPTAQPVPQVPVIAPPAASDPGVTQPLPSSGSGTLPQVAPPAPTPPQTPRDLAPAGTFGPQIQQGRPTFMPGEDQQSPLQQLLSGGFLPPFLSRLFAQQQGSQRQGTNQPFPLNFPKDLPLPSKLGFMQMQPSEQQALLSYASSYGMTPEDFLNAIESVSPQGPRSILPNFGNRFLFQQQ